MKSYKIEGVISTDTNLSSEELNDIFLDFIDNMDLSFGGSLKEVDNETN